MCEIDREGEIEREGESGCGLCFQSHSTLWPREEYVQSGAPELLIVEAQLTAGPEQRGLRSAD